MTWYCNLAAIAVLAVCSASLAGPYGPATKPAIYPGPELPAAPRQDAAWQAPQAQLPEKAVQAVETLFQQGMADPRGCEYREIEIAVGDVWTGGGDTLSTHGWLLPADAEAAHRYAVAWNGLLYPVVSTGKPADLKADIAAIIERDQAAQKQYDAKANGHPFIRRYGVLPEKDAVSSESLTSLKFCMLLRLGEAGLAEQYWKQWAPDLKANPDDPYLLLAREWAWCAWDRAVCAHMRGDDMLSFYTASLLSGALPQIEATAGAHGFPRPPDPNADVGQSTLPYAGFARDLPILLADEQRRVKEAKDPLAWTRADGLADQKQRIAAKISNLDEVGARQWGQPGGVALDSSPIINALESEGEAAVEPLLSCMENDRRLTRSVSFHRDFFDNRNLLPVAQAAYTALARILQTSDFGPVTKGLYGPEANWRAGAQEIRAFWERNKGKTPAERWYATLADDTAQPSQWLEAARRIVQPVDVESRGGLVNIPRRRPGEVPAMRGEALRAKADPSVSELLARRVPQIAGERNGWLFAQHNAADAALCLYRWDAKAAIPVLREQLARCRDRASRANSDGTGNQTVELMAADISRIADALAKAGDHNALSDYSAWVRTQTPAGAGTNVKRMLAPMWQHPDDPAVLAAAEWMFCDPSSPWQCLPKVKNYHWNNLSELANTPLIAVPGFRKGVLLNLTDRSRIGTAAMGETSLDLVMDSAMRVSYGTSAAADSSLLPGVGEERIIRVCDWYAWCIARLGGSPAFEMYWPEDKRDAAIRQCAQFVQDWSARFRYSEQLAASNQPDLLFEPLHMVFPRLDHPATPEEVAAHTAIFSLAGQEVRVVPLGTFPQRARWTTLKQFPVRYQTYDPATNTSKIVEAYDQEGLIWQAEEVLENGQWQRYYGFVGRHIIARVPASEIELLKATSGR